MIEKDAKWGTAYDFFGRGESGAAACKAIGALAVAGQLESTITNFLVPLQVVLLPANVARFTETVG
jgi:hypothetical protein